MTDDVDVRTVLRTLATPDTTDATDPSDIVADATAATRNVRDAAAFVDDGGLTRLRRAIEMAERRGDDALARRGQRTLDTIECCRRAARDHFRPARGTVLSGGTLQSTR